MYRSRRGAPLHIGIFYRPTEILTRSVISMRREYCVLPVNAPEPRLTAGPGCLFARMMVVGHLQRALAMGMVTFSMPTPSVASSARQTGRASGADEGSEKSPIPGRGLACLTAHEPSSTVPLDDKGRLNLIPHVHPDRVGARCSYSGCCFCAMASSLSSVRSSRRGVIEM